MMSTRLLSPLCFVGVARSRSVGIAQAALIEHIQTSVSRKLASTSELAFYLVWEVTTTSIVICDV